MSGDAPPPLDADRRRQYLRRLGIDRPPAPDRAGLRALHRAHLRNVPFENLDIHLGRPILLDIDAVVAKLLDRRRGGYCYELDGAFASLLASLGFEVSILEARVYGDDDVGIRFDHACLRVTVGEALLAAVGFGACFQDPIALAPDIDQLDEAGTYRLTERAGGWLDLHEDGEPRYRFLPTARSLAEFSGGNHHHQTSPASSFTRNTVWSLATDRGRVTLRGRQLIETVDGERTETDLRPDQLGPVLGDRFGIALSDDELALLTRGSGG